MDEYENKAHPAQVKRQNATSRNSAVVPSTGINILSDICSEPHDE